MKNRSVPVRIWLTWLLVFQLIFWGLVFFFNKLYLPIMEPFRGLTREEWEWILAQPDYYPDILSATVVLLEDYARRAMKISGILGLYFLVYRRKSLLVMPRKWKWLLPLLAVVAYVPCFLFVKYWAPHPVLYMDLIPMEVFSLLLLSFILIGKDRTA